MKLIKCSTLLLCALLAFAKADASGKSVKGSGPVKTEKRSAGAFNAIDLNVSGEVYIKEGKDYSIEVEAQQELLQILLTEINGPALEIKYPKGTNVRNAEPVKVYVTLPSVHRLEVAGSGTIYAQDALHTEGLQLQVSGSGNIELANITATDIRANIAGSGNIVLKKGDANSENIQITGSGNIDSRGLRVANATTQISGSGSARVQAQEKLDVTIAGSGDVYYTGKAKVTKKIAGSGSVKSL